MSKQLEAAMAPLPPSAPENPAPFTTFPGPFGQLPSNALFVPSSSPAPLSASAKAPHKKPRAIKAKAGTAHSTAGPPVPNAPGHALQAWGLGGNPLLNSYHAPSLPSTAVIATATATAPLAASKVSTALPTTNAFSWLHSQGLQQPALGSSPVPSGSAPAILSSLAACGNAYRRTFGAHILGTAQDRNQAAGAFPTAALGTASSLGFPQTQGVASTLTAAQTLGAGSAFGAVLGSAPAHAALELTLLLTTLQSLAGSPSQAEGSPVPQTTLTTNCHAATAQLRDWLSQLQHQAMLGTEMVSPYLLVP